jgi:hypothetical protein
VFGCNGAAVHHLAAPHHRHTHRVLARLQLEQCPQLTMPGFLNFFFPQGTPQIVFEAGVELLEQGHASAVNWAARYVSVSVYFGFC